MPIVSHTAALTEVLHDISALLPRNCLESFAVEFASLDFRQPRKDAGDGAKLALWGEVLTAKAMAKDSK